MENKISVKSYLEYLDSKYPNEFDSNWNPYIMHDRAKEQSNFFISLIETLIESSSEITDEDKIFVKSFFKLMADEYWDNLQKERNPKKPKYSSEDAFNIIRTLNCSLEDKLKIAELFEYTEN